MSKHDNDLHEKADRARLLICGYGEPIPREALARDANAMFDRLKQLDEASLSNLIAICQGIRSDPADAERWRKVFVDIVGGK